MKARNREVNIFNMSLLDILCGALGAFCFMMLGLFPFYTPSGPRGQAQADETKKLSQETERMQEEIEKMIENADSEQMAQMLQQQNELLQQLQSQLDEQTGTINQLESENATLKRNNPIVFVADWYGKQDVDIFIEQVGLKGEKKPDPAKKQWPYWAGDSMLDTVVGPGYDVWMMQQVPDGEYRVYLKLVSQNGDISPCRVYSSWLQSPTRLEGNMPIAVLEREKSVKLVGTLVVSEAGKKVSFLPAAPPAGQSSSPAEAPAQLPPDQTLNQPPNSPR